MYKQLSKLVIYRNIPKNSILFRIADICKCFQTKAYDQEELTSEIYEQIHRLLDISTQYGFNNNLWHNYLTFLLVTTENPFSLTCEKTGASDGSVSEKIQLLSEKLQNTKNEELFFNQVTSFYKEYGVGMFGLNKAFRIKDNCKDQIEFIPINNMDKVTLDDLTGRQYRSFCRGKKSKQCTLIRR